LITFSCTTGLKVVFGSSPSVAAALSTIATAGASEAGATISTVGSAVAAVATAVAAGATVATTVAAGATIAAEGSAAVAGATIATEGSATVAGAAIATIATADSLLLISTRLAISWRLIVAVEGAEAADTTVAAVELTIAREASRDVFTAE
jgi:hypothetical protein